MGELGKKLLALALGACLLLLCAASVRSAGARADTGGVFAPVQLVCPG